MEKVLVRYLSTDDGDGGKSLPERQALATVISQNGAGSLDLIDETNQARHRRHFGSDRIGGEV